MRVGGCITPDLVQFETQLFLFIVEVVALPVGAREEVKAPEPNRNEVWILVVESPLVVLHSFLILSRSTQ